jgi:hypothetical protein
MANVMIYENGKAKEYLKSVHTPDFAKREDVLINPVMPEGVALKHIKVANGEAVEMTQGEKDDVYAGEVAVEVQRQKDARNQALSYLQAQVDNPSEPWAIMQFVIGERTKAEIRDMKAGNPRASETDEQVRADIKARLEALKVS